MGKCRRDGPHATAPILPTLDSAGGEKRCRLISIRAMLRMLASIRVAPLSLRPCRSGKPALKFTHPLPYGAIVHDGGVQFVVFSRNATAMRVLLYDGVDDPEPSGHHRIRSRSEPLGRYLERVRSRHRAGQLYHFQADGPHEPQRGYRFDPQARLIDPYCRALAGDFLPAEGGIVRPPKCVVINDEFDWQGDRHLRRNLAETIIYETHVRGFTQSPSSNVENPGTYLGIIEKIPYLKSLGHHGDRADAGARVPHPRLFRQPPAAGQLLGLRPDVLLRPASRLCREQGARVPRSASSRRWCGPCTRPDIEVILDVVFNHTAEGNEQGPTLSFKGLENRVYYMLENGGQHYRNYTGCGNTLNGNHPIVREMIFDCLRHWVHNYHVDGFRFDLASILSRDREGNLVPNPPVVETIGEDPQLADTKIIAEAWDAGRGLPGGHLRQPSLGGVERPLSRRRAALLAGRSAHDRAAGHAPGRLERPVPGQRAAALSQHQLHHLARRLHAQRPGELQLQAQRGQRRRQPRRRQQQLQLQLRRRGAHRRGGRSRPCASARSRI